MTVVSFFVSSTFADFNLERDVLQGPVLEELNVRARPLGGSVELVDLRWGLATHDLTSDEVHRKVLGVCLGEIERCRPCFIGLLGQRFGWVPDTDTLGTALAAYAADGLDLEAVEPNDGPRSITALEHEVGLLRLDEPEAVVFVREVGDRSPTNWTDENPAAVEQLRSRVAQKLPPEHVCHYVAGPSDESWLREFGSQAIEVLWEIVQRRLEQTRTRTGTARDLVWDAFLQDQRRGFVGREELLERVARGVRASKGVVLLGKSGVGKTALWANALAVVGGQFERSAAVSIGIMASESTAAGVAASLTDQLGVSANEQPGVSAVEHWVSAALSSTEPTLVAVDALDRLGEVTADGNPVELATALAGKDNVALLVSTTSVDQAIALQSRGLELIEVDKLEPTEAADMAVILCRPKQLPVEAMLSLAAQQRSPLWVALAVRRLLMVGADDIAPAQGAAESSMALETLICTLAVELPDKASEIAALLFDDCVSRLTYLGLSAVDALSTARRAISSLAVSRTGLRPTDVVSLLEATDGPMIVATLQRTLGPFLRTSGSNGEIAFAHAVLQDAAMRWADENGPLVHKRLALHLLDLPSADSIRSAAAVWHGARSRSGEILAGTFEGLCPTVDSIWDARCISAAEQLVDSLEDGTPAACADARAAVRSVPVPSRGEAALFFSRAVVSSSGVLTTGTADLLTVTATTWAQGADGRDRNLEEERVLLAVLSARAGVLAERREWEEGFIVHERADAAYGRITKLMDSKDSRVIEQLFDMQSASAKLFRSRGQTFRSTAANNTANLMVTVARSAGTFDERLAGRQADSYLDIMETTLFASRYGLARSGLGAARDELVKMGNPDDADVVGAQRWMRLLIAAGCIKLFEYRQLDDAAEALSNAEPLLDQYLGRFPWDLQLLQLQQESEYYLGRSTWQSTSGRTQFGRSLRTYERGLARYSGTPRSHLIAAAAHLNLAELDHVNGDQPEGVRRLRCSIECMARTPADAVERADGLEIIRTFLRHALVTNPSSGRSSRRWRKLVDRGIADPSLLSGEGVTDWVMWALTQASELALDPELPSRKPARWAFARGHTLCLTRMPT